MRFSETVVFRADASLQIGSGHVMRCLTFANLLKTKGLSCHFICREHTGHMGDYIRKQGHRVHMLSASANDQCKNLDKAEVFQGMGSVEPQLRHADWLGVPLKQEIEGCEAILQNIQPWWLVVDHYALDQRWETALRKSCDKLIAIDDLADRIHDCDFILDQNLGRTVEDYRNLVPDTCKAMVGPSYALLRPEFSKLREFSLERRDHVGLRKVLISMGGVDERNATGRLLNALKPDSLPHDCHLTIIMGSTAPWLREVREQVEELPWSAELRVNISNMASEMAESDLAIGAAGSTSWERCCLGLPTLIVVLADNQWPGARALEEAGAALIVGTVDEIDINLNRNIKESTREGCLRRLSACASEVTEGKGSMRVFNVIGGSGEETISA